MKRINKLKLIIVMTVSIALVVCSSTLCFADTTYNYDTESEEVIQLFFSPNSNINIEELDENTIVSIVEGVPIYGKYTVTDIAYGN